MTDPLFVFATALTGVVAVVAISLIIAEIRNRRRNSHGGKK